MIGISVGGYSVASVTIDSTNNTLDTLAQAINNATSAVHASVVNDANGSRLFLGERHFRPARGHRGNRKPAFDG